MFDTEKILSRMTYYSGLNVLSGFVRNALFDELKVLAYHRILDYPENYQYDKELISASTDAFEWQVNYIKKNFTPVTFGELVEHYENNVELPKNPIIITFDDGFLDNYTNAFRILKKHDVKATIFISTDYIGSDRTFWFDWLVHLIKTSDKTELKLDTLNYRLDLNGKNNTRAAYRLLKKMKKVPNDMRLAVIDELEDICNKNNIASPESGPMTWQQVKEMSDWGIEFGSHTVTHPILSNLNKDELRKELIDSKLTIESKLGKPCDVICYPVGMPGAYNDTVIKCCKDVGYKLGVSYKNGTNYYNNLDHFEIKRMHVEREVDDIHFASMCNFPEFL